MPYSARMALDVRTQLGGLNCRVLQSEGEKASHVVVLSHGFGAPGDDLVSLHGELVSRFVKLAGVRFIFPEAPLSLGDMGYGFAARAWWLIDFEKMQAAAKEGPAALAKFRDEEPPGMAKARQMMLKLVDEVSAQTKLPFGKIALTGFSQGAMLSTDVSLRLPEAPLGLGALSGTLLMESLWRSKAKARKGLPVFQSHGSEDQILRFDAAEKLRSLLEESGLKVTWAPFRGGHGIPLEVLEGFGRWLLGLVV